jgi:hypothetical protein
MIGTLAVATMKQITLEQEETVPCFVANSVRKV